LDLPVEDIKSFEASTIESMELFNDKYDSPLPEIRQIVEPKYKMSLAPDIPEVFESLKDEIIKDCIVKLTQKMESLFVERLHKFVPSGFDIKTESKRTFPRLARKIGVNHSEQWWWNDGSETGQLIITFYPAVVDTNLIPASFDSPVFAYGFKYK
jgi:hypothetical protein